MKIAIIGAGAMGGAIVEGLMKGSYVANDNLIVSDCSEERLQYFSGKGARVTKDNAQAAAEADVVVVVVKPWLVEQVLKGIDTANKTVVLVAAGITSEQLQAWTSPDADLWLAIPNIAASELVSMTFLVQVRQKGAYHPKALFDAIGETIMTDEKHLAAGTTLASCGIAYALRYIRAASEGGVELGFKADDAKQIVMQTVLGAVKLLETSGKHPEQLIDQVTTPGGVTIKGLNEMEHAGFTSSVIRGLKAGAK